MQKYVNSALTFRGGIFDPRNQDIVSPETFFDFEIDKPWASYDYILPTGERLTGKLRVKGTIDLTTKISPNIYEIVDYKTGKMLNWGTGAEKGYKEFAKDFQLHLYHYALSRLYPEISQFIVTIYHIQFDMPFTMAFDKGSLIKTEEMLQKRFEDIKACVNPTMLNTWFCERVCSYGKTPHKSLEINPKTGKIYTQCQYIANKIKCVGIEKTSLEETAPGFKSGYYACPGA